MINLGNTCCMNSAFQFNSNSVDLKLIIFNDHYNSNIIKILNIIYNNNGNKIRYYILMQVNYYK